MEELDCRGTLELFDPNITTIYGVRSTQEQIITLMKDWFVGGADLRIMSEDDADSVTWRQRSIEIHGYDAWLEADEDLSCSTRVEVAGPTDVILHFLYTPQAKGIFQSALTELRLIWPDIRVVYEDGVTMQIESTQVERVEDAPKPWENTPDVGWNRRAVELWHAGYKAGEIAAKIGNLTAKTVYNRLSDLRRIYGTDVVPERRAKSRPDRKLG